MFQEARSSKTHQVTSSARLTRWSRPCNRAPALPRSQLALEDAFNAVNAQRVFYGNGGAELNTATTFLSQEQVDLSTQQNSLVGADLSVVASDYSQAQVQQQALLAASGKILSEPTLFDYLPS